MSVQMFCPICKGVLEVTDSCVGQYSARVVLSCNKAQAGVAQYCGATWFLNTKDSF